MGAEVAGANRASNHLLHLSAIFGTYKYIFICVCMRVSVQQMWGSVYGCVLGWGGSGMPALTMLSEQKVWFSHKN